jgi:DNA-binding NtrC family response regulator
MPEINHPDQPGLSDEHPYNLHRAIQRFERGYIANILELTRWDIRKTAQMLGIGTDILAEKIRNYQLSKDH